MAKATASLDGSLTIQIQHLSRGTMKKTISTENLIQMLQNAHEQQLAKKGLSLQHAGNLIDKTRHHDVVNIEGTTHHIMVNYKNGNTVKVLLDCPDDLAGQLIQQWTEEPGQKVEASSESVEVPPEPKTEDDNVETMPEPEQSAAAPTQLELAADPEPMEVPDGAAVVKV